MVFTKAQAKSLSILDIARSLGMDMKRNSDKEYAWKEHDSFKIDTTKNTWHWYSHTGKYGDTINLVQEIRNVSYTEAMTFLETGSFPEAKPIETVKQPFKYTLAPYEQPFKEARTYLKETRGLSDDTIDFFISKGVLSQARRKEKDGHIEDVLVFKYLDQNQNIVGASLQGLLSQPERYEGKGYLKQIMYQSEGISGLNVAIGSPKRLVVTEAPIDLMSYYELHKDELSDVRLVSMDGLKEGVLSHYALELLQNLGEVTKEAFDYTKSKDLSKASNFLATSAQLTTLFHDDAYKDLLTLAVDQDKSGSNFITNLQNKNIPVIDARPPQNDGQDKTDWNDVLKERKEVSNSVDTNKFVPKNQLEQSKKIRGEFEEAPLFVSSALDIYVEEVVQHFTDDILEAEYMFPDGRMVSSMEYGVRGDDHASICNYFDSIGVPELISSVGRGEDFWNLVQSGIGVIRISPETGVGLIAEGQNLTEAQKAIVEMHSLKLEPYLEGTPVTEELLQNKFNIKLEFVSDSQNKNTPVIDQEVMQTIKKAPEKSQKQLKNAEGTIGDFPEKQEAAPLPEAKKSQPLNDLSPNQTQPQPYLHFTINEESKSIDKRYYHSINSKDLAKLNRYAPIIQQTAQWYLDTVADSRIHYLYKDGDNVSSLVVQFDRDKFMHLTGIFPHREGQTAEQSLLDFANGNGNFDTILIANKGAAFDKIKVIPELEAIVESDAFYFGDLSEVSKLKRLDLDKAIKSRDEDIILALRTVDGTTFPASLMKLREPLKLQLNKTNEERTILGVYRERGEIIDQLSINSDYIKDGGQQLMDILKQGEQEILQGDILNDEVAQVQPTIDSDGDGISDEEELKQGTNPYDFRSTPSQKSSLLEDTTAEVTDVVVMENTISDIIKNKDITGLNRHLKEGIKEYFDSDKYKDYLTKMSQLNNYSSRNLRMILSQNPKASLVASLSKWNSFGRHIKKGEKSLRIVAPVTKIEKDKNGQPMLDKNGKPKTLTFFHLVPVFDVTQTDGKDLPKAVSEVKEQLTDLEYANLYRALMSVAKANQVSVRFEELDRDTKGYYNPKEHQIVLHSKDMNKDQIIKTLLHETAHSELHHSNHPQKEQLTRSTAELQAESVAYVVASYYGMDTSEYSFGYLASWSTDKETLTDLEAQLDIVQQESKSLMDRMDQELARLQVVQQRQEQHKFSDKLQKFKDKSAQEIKDRQKEQRTEAQSKKEKGILK